MYSEERWGEAVKESPNSASSQQAQPVITRARSKVEPQEESTDSELDHSGVDGSCALKKEKGDSEEDSDVSTVGICLRGGGRRGLFSPAEDQIQTSVKSQDTTQLEELAKRRRRKVPRAEIREVRGRRRRARKSEYRKGKSSDG